MIKKRFARALSAILGAALLTFPASAAPAATVTLDGAPLALSQEAQPIIRNGRTFVPFRAIFEAMGATVAWDGGTKTVSAARDGRAVAFVIGQKTVTVTEQGEQSKAAVDAAAFIENGNTFVPVRFAAQAFGATVGWDEAAKTALIVDRAKLMKNAAQDASFSLMNHALSFAFPTETRNWSGRVALDYTLHTPDGDVLIPIKVYLSTKMDGSSASGIITTEAALAGMTAARSKNSDALPESVANLLTTFGNTTVAFVLSRPDGALYLKGAAFDSAGVPGGAWVRLPMENGVRALSNGAYGEGAVTGVMRNDFAAVIADAAGAVSLKSAAVDNVSLVRGALETMIARYQDKSFAHTADTAVLTASTRTADGADETTVLHLTLDAEDAVTALAREHTIAKNGQTVLQTSMALQADGSMALTGTIRSKTYSLTLDGALTGQPAEDTPERRPTGTIVPK